MKNRNITPKILLHGNNPNQYLKINLEKSHIYYNKEYMEDFNNLFITITKIYPL